MTELPRPIEFMTAGFDLLVYSRIERSWPTLGESERQAILARLKRLQEMQTEDRGK